MSTYTITSAGTQLTQSDFDTYSNFVNAYNGNSQITLINDTADIIIANDITIYSNYNRVINIVLSTTTRNEIGCSAFNITTGSLTFGRSNNLLGTFNISGGIGGTGTSTNMNANGGGAIIGGGSVTNYTTLNVTGGDGGVGYSLTIENNGNYTAGNANGGVGILGNITNYGTMTVNGGNAIFGGTVTIVSSLIPITGIATIAGSCNGGNAVNGTVNNLSTLNIKGGSSNAIQYSGRIDTIDTTGVGMSNSQLTTGSYNGGSGILGNVTNQGIITIMGGNSIDSSSDVGILTLNISSSAFNTLRAGTANGGVGIIGNVINTNIITITTGTGGGLNINSNSILINNSDAGITMSGVMHWEELVLMVILLAILEL